MSQLYARLNAQLVHRISSHAAHQHWRGYCKAYTADYVALCRYSGQGAGGVDITSSGSHVQIRLLLDLPAHRRALEAVGIQPVNHNRHKPSFEH
jgi:hypothetical protein